MTDVARKTKARLDSLLAEAIGFADFAATGPSGAPTASLIRRLVGALREATKETGTVTYTLDGIEPVSQEDYLKRHPEHAGLFPPATVPACPSAGDGRLVDAPRGPLALSALRRPPAYATLGASAQWEIDKTLGILDWDGDPRK